MVLGDLMEKRLMELKQELLVSAGKEEADLIIHNIRILDVFTEEITEGSLVIKNGRIVAQTPRREVKAKETYDGRRHDCAARIYGQPYPH